jgi:hypothetical protein
MKYTTDILSEIQTWCHYQGIIIKTSDVLINANTGPTDIYRYDPLLKKSTLLTVSPQDTVLGSLDVAHTSNKLWVYKYNLGTFTYDIREFNITMKPFTATYNREITNVPVGSGLCAISDTKLIAIKREDALNTKVYECDITNNISVNTYKFNLPANHYVSGDYLLTTTNKLIVTLLDSDENKLYISQYDYLTGILDMTKEITYIMLRPYGVFEYETDIYIVANIGTYPNDTGEIYKIDKTSPYGLTLYDTIPYGPMGASQIPEQLTVHFT